MNKILLVYEDYADLMSAESALKRAGFDVVGLSSEYAVAEQVLAFNPDLIVASGRGGKVSSLGVGKRLKEMTRWLGKVVLIFPAKFKPDPQDLIRIRVDMVLEAPVSPVRLVLVVGKSLGHEETVLLDRLNKVMNTDATAARGPAGFVSGKPATEEEAIFVKGSVPEEDKSLGSERVREDSQEFILNNQEQKGKVSFRFGDRITSGAADSDEVAGSMSEKDSETAFADVDLKALERELLGGGVPEVERVEASPVHPESLGQIDVDRAQEHVAERVAKYKALVADVKVPPKSTITRIEARRRQKQLTAEWDVENTKELDELRREFTKALFKK